MIGIGSAIAYWNIYRKQIIRNKPENTVSDKSNGLYSVRYDKLTMDEAAGNLSGNNMNLFYDSTEYISLLENNEVPPPFFKLIFLKYQSIATPTRNAFNPETPCNSSRSSSSRSLVNIFCSCK